MLAHSGSQQRHATLASPVPMPAARSPQVPAQAAPPAASPVTAADDHQPVVNHSTTSDDGFAALLAQTRQEISTHLYQRGFLTGMLSDVTVRAFKQDYQLHRLLLVRSPLFEAILADQRSPQLHHDMSGRPMIDLPVEQDANIDPESLSIVFAYLYGAPIAAHVKPENVHGVLACAHMLQLRDLCAVCVQYIVRRLCRDNVLATVRFVDSSSSSSSDNGGTNSTSDLVDSSSPVAGRYGDVTVQLREACMHYLAFELPRTTHAFTTNPDRQPELVDVFSWLPFRWLKTLIEERLVVPSEFEKFQFARRVIDCRKERATAAAQSAQSTNGRQSRHASVVPFQETVLLRFDQMEGGRVAVMEHVAKKAPLMKHIGGAVATTAAQSVSTRRI